MKRARIPLWKLLEERQLPTDRKVEFSEGTWRAGTDLTQILTPGVRAPGSLMPVSSMTDLSLVMLI